MEEKMRSVWSMNARSVSPTVEICAVVQPAIVVLSIISTGAFPGIANASPRGPAPFRVRAFPTPENAAGSPGVE